jgi:hypothetical protein
MAANPTHEKKRASMLGTSELFLRRQDLRPFCLLLYALSSHVPS